MNSLNHLNKIIKRLKSHEIENLNSYLHAFKVNHMNPESRSANLIELLADDKQPKMPEVLQFKIYGKTNMPAFERLVRRTRDKVYESLLLENNLRNEQSHSIRNRVGYDLRKKLIEAEIMASRGLTEDNETLYEYMLNKASQYEFYDIVLEILYTKHTFSSFRYGIKRINKIASEIRKYEKIRSAVNNARITFDSFGARINFSASPDEYSKDLPKAIDKLEKDYQDTNSPTIGYYLYLLQTEQFQQFNELENANITLLKLAELLKLSPSVRSETRLGHAYINIANNEMLRFKFESGLEYADTAIQYVKNTTVNLNVVREAQFMLYLFSQNFLEAEKLIALLYQLSAMQKTSFLFYKRTFLFACLKNLQGDYKRSEELLNEVREIEKDKEGWNIGIRLLQIMNLVDRGKSELLESHVTNMKKYLLRLKGQTQARKRYSVIVRILTRFMNDNYQFRKTYKRSQKYFDLLASDDANYSWSVKGHEVIAFHEWFISRMEFRKYSYKNLFAASDSSNPSPGAVESRQ